MKKNSLKNLLKKVFIVLIFLTSVASFAQYPTSTPTTPSTPTQKSAFWSKVRFGSGIGLGFGSGYTNISLAPSAVYQVNQYYSVGAGIQYSYLNQKDLYTSNMYGVSFINLFNPIEQIQLSAEIEELKATVSYTNSSIKSNGFWNTALFLGAGYRMGGTTIGARYNVLYNKDKDVYGSALVPFVRVYF